jgi:hypothetical protein
VRWDVLVFHEQVRQGWYILAEVFFAAVIVGGVVMLARSPLLAENDSSREKQQSALQGDGSPGHDQVLSESGA